MRRAATPATKNRPVAASRAMPSAMKGFGSPAKNVVQGQGAACATEPVIARSRNAIMAFMAFILCVSAIRTNSPIDLAGRRWSNPTMSALFPLVEDERRTQLEQAQSQALMLFDAIERDGLVRPGVTEREVEDQIGELAAREFGVEKHWHKRIVRAGANGITTAGDNPAVRTIEPDDIVYVDLGPVFEAWEADIGKSYALGTDPHKHRLVADLPRVFDQVQAHYKTNPNMT